MKRLNGRNGFSLIELLVVISIIGVLTAVLMMNLVGARERSRDAQKIQDLNNLKSALGMYYNDNQAYPTGTVLNLGTSYLVGTINVGYTYTVIDGGDGFILRTTLESGAGTNDEDSQKACGLTPASGVYSVCAN